jgi:hypothetical protein
MGRNAKKARTFTPEEEERLRLARRHIGIGSLALAGAAIIGLVLHPRPLFPWLSLLCIAAPGILGMLRDEVRRFRTRDH